MLIDYKAELIMWDKVDMPESIKNETTGKFEKTGKKIEMTNYIFRDFDGSKLVFTSNNPLYRTYERKDVIIQLELSYDDFNRKNKIQLRGVSLAQ